MASSLAGGPQLDTPLIPLPEAAKPKHRPTEPVEAALQTALPTVPTSDGTTKPGDGSSSTSTTESPSSTTGTTGATTAPATTAPTGPATPGVSPTIVPPVTPVPPTLTVVPTSAPTSTAT